MSGPTLLHFPDPRSDYSSDLLLVWNSPHCSGISVSVCPWRRRLWWLSWLLFRSVSATSVGQRRSGRNVIPKTLTCPQGELSLFVAGKILPSVRKLGPAWLRSGGISHSRLLLLALHGSLSYCQRALGLGQVDAALGGLFGRARGGSTF